VSKTKTAVSQPAHRLARVESLTGLRWFAAAAVFFHHFMNFAPIPKLSKVTPIGVTGVSFFFVLSGFVLTWSFFDRDTAKRFYWRRFARVYPLVVITTLVALPVFYGTTDSFQKPWDTGSIALSLVLLHAWFSGLPLIFFGGNPASWSLSCEAFFYAVFPAVIRPLLRRSIPVLLTIAASIVAIMWVLLLWARFQPPGLIPGTSLPFAGLMLASPVGRVWEFLLGVVVACAVRRGWRPPVGFWPAVGLLAAGMLLLVVWVRNPGWSTGFVKSTSAQNQVTAPLYALVIAAAAVRDIDGKRSFLRHRAMVSLGQWSYAFYLTHATVIYLARLIWGQQPASAQNLVFVIPLLLATTFVAFVFYRLIEHPVEHRLRSMLPPLEPDKRIDAPDVEPEKDPVPARA
jgi:peptidoglycan/LPS O-acetylase OafA/YrhL